MMLLQRGQRGQGAVCLWTDSRLVYMARGVSEAVFLLHQNMAGLEGVVVEDLEEWEVLVMVCPYEGSQKEPVEA